MIESYRRYTIKDVAREAGVSVSTASLALNNRGRVSEKTQRHVIEAAEKLHYFANVSAKSLRLTKTSVIGLIVPDITNLFYSNIVDKIRELVEGRGCFLIMGITGNKVSNEKKYISEFLGRKVDGIIVIPMLKYNSDVSHIEAVMRYGIPVVLLSANYKGVEAPCVMCNLSKGMYDLTRLLLEKGLNRISLITGDKRVDNDYILGFKTAFQDSGLEADESLIVESEITFDSAYTVSKQILGSGLQAIMTISDLMACAAIQAARTAKLSIPDDIAITGYDDELYARINQMPITTVRQPIALMCKRSVEYLFDMIENDKRFSCVELLSPEIVIRETTP